VNNHDGQDEYQQPAKAPSLEALLVQKNKRLQDELTAVKVSLSAFEAQLHDAIQREQTLRATTTDQQVLRRRRRIRTALRSKNNTVRHSLQSLKTTWRQSTFSTMCRFQRRRRFRVTLLLLLLRPSPRWMAWAGQPRRRLCKLLPASVTGTESATTSWRRSLPRSSAGSTSSKGASRPSRTTMSNSTRRSDTWRAIRGSEQRLRRLPLPLMLVRPLPGL